MPFSRILRRSAIAFFLCFAACAPDGHTFYFTRWFRQWSETKR